MHTVSRRNFLATGAAMAAASLLPPHAFGDTQKPVGLQLYSVREQLAKDYPGTLAKVAAIGYRDVEAAGFYNHSASDVKQLMSTAGLHCISAHYSLFDLLKATGATIDYARTLGLEYVICSSPYVADPARFAASPGGVWGAIQHSLTPEDWKWNAGQFNEMGRKFKAIGIQFGYHNHTPEFRDMGQGQYGYDILLKETDPSLVTFELDCGWAAASGQNPAALIREHSDRITLLHLKDFMAATPESSPTKDPGKRISTEIGYGVVDFKPILAAAKAANIKHPFIEQEAFDKPPFEALKIDFDNVATLEAGGTIAKP